MEDRILTNLTAWRSTVVERDCDFVTHSDILSFCAPIGPKIGPELYIQWFTFGSHALVYTTLVTPHRPRCCASHPSPFYCPLSQHNTKAQTQSTGRACLKSRKCRISEHHEPRRDQRLGHPRHRKVRLQKPIKTELKGAVMQLRSVGELPCVGGTHHKGPGQVSGRGVCCGPRQGSVGGVKLGKRR